jgi:hypothetical protein
LTTIDNHQTNEILIEKNNPPNCQPITPVQTTDYSSFTRITPLKTKPIIQFEVCHEEDDFVLPNVQEMIDNIQISINHDQIIPRPPPLLALSQAIRRKHPEQLIETKLNNPLPSIEDLPNAPANYSFVFHGFTST